jgi:hypothetical protein
MTGLVYGEGREAFLEDIFADLNEAPGLEEQSQASIHTIREI